MAVSPGKISIFEVPSLATKKSLVFLIVTSRAVGGRGSRYTLCFVEDQDDVDFYSTLWEVLTYTAGDTTKGLLSRTPSLVFLPASVGTGRNRTTTGGSSVVRQWVDKFDQAPLDELTRGFIDLDSGNRPAPRIEVLGRYSFENYLLDPLIVYGLLLEDGSAPAVPGVQIAKGDEHRIRDLAAAQLQDIVDVVCAAATKTLQPPPGPSDLVLTDAELTTGAKIKYPDWMLTRRGHDLLPVFQCAFGQRLVTPPNLLRLLLRVRLVPTELLTAMKNLQT